MGQVGAHAVTEEDGRHGRQPAQRLGDGQHHLGDRTQGRLPHSATVAWQFDTAHFDTQEFRGPLSESGGGAPGERETHQPDRVARSGSS